MKTITIDEIKYNIPDDVLERYRVDDLKPFAEMPEGGTVYFYEGLFGDAYKVVWQKRSADINHFNVGNCYRTLKGAKAHGGYKRAVARRTLVLEYERYIVKHGEVKGEIVYTPVFDQEHYRWSYMSLGSDGVSGHTFLRRHTAAHAVELGEKFGKEIKTLWS